MPTDMGTTAGNKKARAGMARKQTKTTQLPTDLMPLHHKSPMAADTNQTAKN